MNWRLVAIAASLSMGFLAGATFVYFKPWPYHLLRQHGVAALLTTEAREGCGGFCQEMFSDEIVAHDRLLPDVLDRAALVEAVDAMAAPRMDVRGVGDAIRLKGPLTKSYLPKDRLDISSVPYELDGRRIEVYAYRLQAAATSTSGCATLIVPGSGHNQALAIAQRDTRNYHSGILEPYIGCDVFVLIKPNEDYLSLTRAGRKLTENAYINHLIGIGNSYSSRYLIDAIALVKELKRQYSHTIVTGLSQGGAAAVLIGIEASPSITVSASGLFELGRDLGYGGFNSSLLFPGLQRTIFKEWLPHQLRVTETDFLILNGSREEGFAGEDAREGWTCGMLSGMPRVTCLSHAGGHIYPSESVKRYLSRRLPPLTTQIPS